MARKYVRVNAKCASFDIEVEAKINTKGLVADEIEQVQKELKHKMTAVIAKLPFAHIYPYEVTVK